MDTRPIGVFDSGLGGLTTVAKLMEILPREDIIYFGDTGRVPYGGRSRNTLLKYARQDIAFLRSFDIKAIVAACGTVSTTVLDQVAAESDIPVLGVLAPAAAQAVQQSASGRIGVIATQASIRSGAYEKTIRAIDPKAQVFAKACPLFVPLVENGRTQKGDVVIETVAREYLAYFDGTGIDTMILGCTHYPLLQDLIGEILGPQVALVDTGAEAAKALVKTLAAGDLEAPAGQRGSVRFYVSDDTEFSHLASLFLGRDVGQAVEEISLDSF